MFHLLSAGAQDTLTLERLDYQFVTFEDGRYSPVVSLEETALAGVLVPCAQDVQIEVCGDARFSLWVDGRWVLNKGTSGCLHLAVQAICQHSERDTVFLSFMAEKTLEGIEARTFSVIDKADKRFALQQRRTRPQFWHWGILLGAFLLVGLRFIDPFGGLRLLRPAFESNYYRFVTWDNLILLGLGVWLSAFAWSYVTASASAWSVFELVPMLLLVWLIKILLILFAGSIFRFSRQAAWQITLWVQGWARVSIFLLLLVTTEELFFDGSLLSVPFYHVLTSVTIAGLSALVSYHFMMQRGSKSLHIIIYLCSTEILPSAMVLFWLLK